MRRVLTKWLLVVLVVALIPVGYRSYNSYRSMRELDAVLHADHQSGSGHNCSSEPKEMVPKLTRLLERDPKCLQARYALAEAYDSLGNPAQEERQYKLAVQYAPRSAEAHCKLGEFYFTKKRHIEAARSFRKCLALERDYPSAREYLARSYERHGDRRAALKVWREVLLQTPGDEIAQRAVKRLAANAQR